MVDGADDAVGHIGSFQIGDVLSGELDRKGAGGIVQIGEYLRQRLGVHLPEQPLPLRIRQQRNGFGHIPPVVVLQQLR